MEFSDLVYLVVFILWLLKDLFSKKKPSAPPSESRPIVPVDAHPSFQRVPKPPTLKAASTEAAETEAVLEAPERRQVVHQGFYRSVPRKEPKRVPAEVRPVPPEPVPPESVRMDRSMIARQVTEALLLGDILLRPRSRGR